MRMTKDILVDIRNENGAKEAFVQREQAYMEIQKNGGTIISCYVLPTGNSGFMAIMIDYETGKIKVPASKE